MCDAEQIFKRPSLVSFTRNPLPVLCGWGSVKQYPSCFRCFLRKKPSIFELIYNGVGILGAEIAQSGGRQAAVPSGTVQTPICDSKLNTTLGSEMTHIAGISYPYLWRQSDAVWHAGGTRCPNKKKVGPSLIGQLGGRGRAPKV